MMTHEDIEPVDDGDYVYQPMIIDPPEGWDGDESGDDGGYLGCAD